MKRKSILAFLIFFFSSFYIQAQISTSQTNFKFNNAPVLNIDNLRFIDENNNQLADAEEKCALFFRLKNTGKNIANGVNILVTTTDSSLHYFTFESTIPVGDINVGETKEIKIPFQSGIIFNDTTITFEIIAKEAGKFNSKPALIKIPFKSADVSISVNWYYPIMHETKVTENIYVLKACINSYFPVTDFSIMVNNKTLSIDRSFKSVKTENCNFYIEKELKLEKGENLVQIIARNEKSMIASEIRNIILAETEFENRTALIIGNSAYDMAPLKNPANDAKAMAKILRQLKFDVIEIIDGSIENMRNGVDKFTLTLEEKKGVGLFYYAGHGLQVKGENYLIPVNQDIKSELEVENKAIRVNSILEEMEITGTRLNIVILDACRNNPFARSFRSGNRGLAQVNTIGNGSIIAYATSPGSVAADGDGDNGLYTQELLKAIKTPGLEIGMVFRAVFSNVKKQSNGQQLPWTNQAIEGEFYFVK
jgi:hypothetical protein